MEFKYRSVDFPQPNYFPPPAAPPPWSTFFNPLSARGFRPNPNFNHIQSNSNFNHIGPNPNFNQIGLHSCQPEFEKAQIRQEIIASEIARLRALETEVRIELMTEWEMAIRHREWDTNSSFEPWLTMPVDRWPPFTHHHFNLNNRYSWLPQTPFNLSPSPPPPPCMRPPPVTELLNSKVDETSVGNKNKLIMLDKPDPNCSIGAKGKTQAAASIGEMPWPVISLKNKPDEVWSCAICQVNATNEKGFNKHLQGKKHKKKEAQLKAERMGKNSYTTTLPKKPSQSVQKLVSKEKLKNTNDEQLIQREEKADIIKKETESTAPPPTPPPPPPPPPRMWLPPVTEVVNSQAKLDPKCSNGENLKIQAAAGTGEMPRPVISLNNKPDEEAWSCAICQVSATNEREFNDHLQGKKHKKKEARLKARRMEKNSNTTTLPKKPGQPDQKLKNTNDEQLTQKDEKADTLEKEPGSTATDKVEITPENIVKKYEFWCELCSVGAHSEVEMEGHKKGKKHIADSWHLIKRMQHPLLPLPLK